MTVLPCGCKIVTLMNDVSLETLLREMKRNLAPHYQPGFLHRSHTVFQFFFEEDAPFHLVASEDTFDLAPGVANAPTLSLFIDTHDTCWGLIQGRLDGMQMFMEGRYRADGNIVLSQLLLYLFKSEDDAKFYEVQD